MITAYIKPTNFCNVGCSHCYLPLSVRDNAARMSMATLAETADLLATMQKRARHAGVTILWHGGEPLTVPPAWYEAAGAVLDHGLPGHQQAIQTSLIPWRPAYIPLVRERCGSQIGSSLDFSQRKLKGSVEAFHELWMSKVEAARAEGIFVLPGVVPTKAELGREAWMVGWFVERGFSHFNIDRYNAYGAVFPDRPSNAEHAGFLTRLFDALMAELARSGRAPLVSAMVAVLRGVLFGLPGERWGGTCQSDFVVVEPDGSLNTCPDRTGHEPAHSNVADGFDAFAGSRFRRKWIRHQQVTHKENHCTACENNSWCGSACPVTPNGAPQGEDECSGYKSFITHVRQATKIPAGRALADAYLRQMSLSPWGEAALSYGGTRQSEDRALLAAAAA